MSFGFLCGPTVYEYEGITFEYSPTGGPWPLKKDGELKKLAGKKFYAMFKRFNALPDDVKKSHKIGGGCLRA